MDIGGFTVDKFVGGQEVFRLMKECIKLSSCTIVHSKLVILGKDDHTLKEFAPEGGIRDTPNGFTSVVLIDESHVTCHCYSDKGMLAIDIFTCGNTTNPDVLINYLYAELKKLFPDIFIIEKNKLDRFPALA
jgi:S-adenosylmethionine/arginine decarboxylase-like enzyme